MRDMTPDRTPAMTLPTRLIALLLGLAIGVLWAAQAAGAPALPDLVVGEATPAAATSADPAGRSADRPGTAAADPSGETDVSPPGGLPPVAATAAAPGARPQRVALPHAPWIEGLLRPPRAC
jgi:hypothetical protein